jgi:uncharacterized membrane protein
MGAGLLFLYRAYETGPMSIAAPLAAVIMVSIPVVGSFILGDRLTTMTVLGLVLGLAAIALLSMGQSVSIRGTASANWAGISAGVLLGLFVLTIAVSGQDQNASLLLMTRLAAGVFAFSLLLGRHRRIRFPHGSVTPVIACGALSVLGNLSFLLAVQQGRLSIAAALASLGPALTVLLAVIVYDEVFGLRRSIGLGLALVAAMVLSLA